MTKAAPPANAPNNDQIRQFAGYVAKWQEKLGLQGWRIERSRRKTPGNMADVKVTFPSQLASWTLGDFGATPIDPHSLESTAVHELLHILLYPIWYLTNEEAPTQQIEAAEHAAINVLEKLLCPAQSASLTSQESQP